MDVVSIYAGKHEAHKLFVKAVNADIYFGYHRKMGLGFEGIITSLTFWRGLGVEVRL